MMDQPIAETEVDFPWCGENVRYWALARPDQVALTDPLGSVTYSELEALLVRAETDLAERGLGPGDRLLVICENSIAAAVTLTAAQRLRAWPVPVNARMTAVELDKIAAHCAPRLVAATDGVSPEAGAHGDRLGISDPFGTGARIGLGPAPGAPEPVADDPALDVAALIYTTGTTGDPKGVMLTHDNLMYVAAKLAKLRNSGDDEHIYCALPLSHIFGLGAVLGAVLNKGNRVDLVPRFDPAEVLRAFAEDGVTTFSGVPAMYAAMVAMGEARGGVTAPTLRFMSSGGAPLDPALKARVEAMFGLPLFNGYGLTESAPLGMVTPHDKPSTDTSVGPPIDGVDARVVDMDGADLARGEVGELWMRGRHIMRGYYKAPDLTAEVITPDDWFKTGDLARIDDRGWVYIAGRKKELIIRSGFNVYPPEIEGVLTKHPAIAVAAVVGRSAAEGNEDIIAFLELKPGKDVDLRELESLVAAELAPYKRPAEYHVRSPLPAAATGKILKHKLLGLLEG